MSSSSSTSLKSPTFQSTTATMKSSSVANATSSIEHDDDVSEMSLSESQSLHSSSGERHQRNNDKSYLFDKFLNSSYSMNFRLNGARNSLSSRDSNASLSLDSSIISLNILKDLESQMLYGDLRRESFQARSGTKNFCLNPLFEEGVPTEVETQIDNRNVDESENLFKGVSLSSSCSRSSRVSECSSDEFRVNCVEEIFVELSKIRRSASVSSSHPDAMSGDEHTNSSFAIERCNSLKRCERLLK